MLKNKPKVFFLYILAFITLVVVIAIPHFQKLQFSEKVQIEKFKSELINKESELDKSLLLISELVVGNKSQQSEIPILQIEKMISSNTFLLILEFVRTL